MNIMDQLLYRDGYIAGYWDGVRDACCGKITQWQTNDLMNLPIKAMGLSSRATNCLTHYGCAHVNDVIHLNSAQILRMRNLGPKTASEIAQWVIEHGILNSAWSEYI